MRGLHRPLRRARRLLAAFACGKILNTKTARSQFQGGVVFGLGVAAAVTNAAFDATGIRVRSLPLTPDKFLRGTGTGGLSRSQDLAI
jgi:CO/xanthine dehydrogenase Mo-binding subunit